MVAATNIVSLVVDRSDDKLQSLRPVTRWVGGKGKLLPELRKLLPAKFNRYYEPFVGGGALFFDLAKNNSVIGDANKALITAYSALANDVGGVIERLRAHKAAHYAWNSYYYQARENWNQGLYGSSQIDLAAAFIYLMGSNFNGLWRVNSKGHYNVPKGAIKAPKFFEVPHLNAVSRLLKTTAIRSGSYEETCFDLEAGDLVYCDSPYDAVSDAANFVNYTAEGFNKDDQHDLANWARAMKAKGVFVMLSNADTTLIRYLYSDFHLHEVRAPRRINSKKDGRGDVAELIITSY